MLAMTDNHRITNEFVGRNTAIRQKQQGKSRLTEYILKYIYFAFHKDEALKF